MSRPERFTRAHVAPPTADSDVLGNLQTEQARHGLEDLDLRPVGDLVSLLLDAEARVPRIMGAVHAELTAAATVVAERLAAGGRLVYVGAGTPGRIGVADAAECPPTYGVGSDVVLALTAAEASARSDAYEAAEDDRSAAVSELERIGLSDADVVVGIAASGRTPFAVHALTRARELGASTIAIANNVGSVIGQIADIAIEIQTGPEVVAGSTRLTAGTSQKIALNVISTAAMVANGHTYGPWMIHMQASNGKLRHRAARIVCGITGSDERQAADALALVDDDIELACLVLRHRLRPAQARTRLEEAGSFRKAFDGSSDAHEGPTPP